MRLRLSSNQQILLLAAIAGLLLVAIGQTRTAPPASIPIQTVEAWLHQVDRLDADASWKEASSFLQQKLTKEKWETILKTTRAPIGTVLTRRHAVTQYASRLTGIPEGTYALLQFHSTFTGKESAVESVVFSKEPDGHWRALGYSMK